MTPRAPLRPRPPDGLPRRRRRRACATRSPGCCARAACCPRATPAPRRSRPCRRGRSRDVAWPRGAGCLLLDVRMPRHERAGAVRPAVERGLLDALPVIFLTGHADVPTAVAAVKRGAFDFVEKPFSDNALVDRVEQALAAQRRRARTPARRRTTLQRAARRADRARARRDAAGGRRPAEQADRRPARRSACARSKCTARACSTRWT